MTPLGSAVQSPEPTWEGDRAFVWVEIVTLCLGFLVGSLMVPSALEKVSRGRSISAGSMSSSSVQSSVMGMLVCVFAVVIVTEGVILSGIWRGRQWAYVTLTIFLLFGICIQMTRLLGTTTGPTANLGGMFIFGLLMGIAKLVFCGVRLSGSLGPPLK